MTVLEVQKNVNARLPPPSPSFSQCSPSTQTPRPSGRTTTRAHSARAQSFGRQGEGWSGSQKGIIIEGANGSEDAAAGIKSGVITATWDPQPTVMGSIAVELLAMYLKDHKPLSSLPKLIVVPMKVWDLSNIKSYINPLKRVVTVGPIPASYIVTE